MQAWILKIITKLTQYLATFLFERIISSIRSYLEKRAEDKARESKFEEAKKNIIEAGKDPNLSPEERAKVQEDAFKKYINDINSRS